jgi:hypothetical protein
MAGAAPARARSRPCPPEAGGRIRVRDARTIHSNYDAATTMPTGAENRYRLTLSRISRVDIALDRFQAHLPPAPSANRPPQGGTDARSNRAVQTIPN